MMNIKKVIIAFTLSIFLVFPAFAQSMYGDEVKADVKMNYVYSFEEALKLSKEQNKLIFFNCFADWAIPCHGMNKMVFSDQAFADWMDKNFINFFIDVTKGGKYLAERYNIQNQAHYLVLDANGDIVHRIIGGSEIPQFKALLQQSLSDKTSLSGLNKKYESGDRSLKFLRQYFEVLKVANEDETVKVVLGEIMSKMKPKDWSKKENWKVFNAMMKNTNDKYFTYLVDNRKEFAKNNGEEKVFNVMSNMYSNQLFSYMAGDSVYNAGKFLDIYLELQKTGLPESDHVFISYDFAKSRGEGRIADMLTILSTKMVDWSPSLLRIVDLSFEKYKSLSKEDLLLVTQYLVTKGQSIKWTTANHYKRVVAKLNNKDGIKFLDLSFDKALNKASSEGKWVFMDCFTTWCAPCKWLDENTFRDKELGDYFNKNFVSIKVDMEKGEGIELRKKYEINAFPTLLLLNPDGTINKKMVGAMDVKKLMEQVKGAMEAAGKS